MRNPDHKVWLVLAFLLCLALVGVGIYSAVHFVQTGTDGGLLIIMLGVAFVILAMFLSARRDGG